MLRELLKQLNNEIEHSSMLNQLASDIETALVELQAQRGIMIAVETAFTDLEFTVNILVASKAPNKHLLENDQKNIILFYLEDKYDSDILDDLTIKIIDKTICTCGKSGCTGKVLSLSETGLWDITHNLTIQESSNPMSLARQYVRAEDMIHMQNEPQVNHPKPKLEPLDFIQSDDYRFQTGSGEYINLTYHDQYKNVAVDNGKRSMFWFNIADCKVIKNDDLYEFHIKDHNGNLETVYISIKKH